jgi:DNA invertase Pin-like site-specific DNA recombinase
MAGAEVMRLGFQAFMAAALRKEFDIVLSEALDRLSRDQEDTVFKWLTFAGVNIVTVYRRLCWAAA